MEPDICIIVNARSGKRRGHALGTELRAAIARHGAERFALRGVQNGERIGAEVDRAVRDGFRTIVAAGGDGTVNAVAARLIESDCRLGILPLGTFNYLARSLGISPHLDDAVRILVEGEERGLDVGDVNGRIFFNNASLGIYATILEQRERTYRQLGRNRLVACWAVLTTLLGRRARLSLKISVDGEVQHLRTPVMFAANNVYQLERLGLEGGDCIKSHRLALFVAPDCGRSALVRLAIGLVLHRLTSRHDFKLLCGTDIVIEAHRGQHYLALDGERVRIASPFRFRVRQNRLRILAPACLPPALA